MCMNKYFEAVSLFRRRNYDKCLEVCNTLLQSGGIHESIVDGSSNSQWIKDGIWQLKMRALTQRVFVDDLETNDDGSEDEEQELERLATAARPGTSIKTAFTPRPGSSLMGNRPKTFMTRPPSGMLRPGTSSRRPGSSLTGRPASRCGTARRIRIASATAYNLGDPTSALFQAAKLNPTIYAERTAVVRPLFQFLFYHENDPHKAYILCEAVAEAQKENLDWWWNQQRGRCLLAMNRPLKAEEFLNKSLSSFVHPDTYLLLCKLYSKIEDPSKAMQLLESAIETLPYETTLRTQRARLYEEIERMSDSVQAYRFVVQLDPIHAEALACIAVHYFYDNQPEIALMYYRRILTMGAHSAELYCNIALCCLYGGILELVLPCFQRSLYLATTPEQRSDIWYNVSFAAITIGDANLARRCLRLSLTSDSSNGAALNNLAVLASQAGTHAKAKSYLLAAQSVQSDCLEIKRNLKIIRKYL